MHVEKVIWVQESTRVQEWFEWFEFKSDLNDLSSREHMSSREFKRNIHSIGNMEITTRYLMKESISIVRVCNGYVFLKRACPNTLDCPLLGLGHNFPNLSGRPLRNGCGLMVMPQCKVRLNRNVFLQEMTLWANIIGMEIIYVGSSKWLNAQNHTL